MITVLVRLWQLRILPNYKALREPKVHHQNEAIREFRCLMLFFVLYLDILLHAVS